MELHDVFYGIEYVARPLLLFFSSENRLLWFRYREYDLAHLKLVFEFSIYKVWKSVGYGVSKYWIRRIGDFLEHGYAVSSLMDTTFDSVSWKYLDFVLLNLGFGSKWCSWIRACLSSSRASVLVNSSPTLEFSIKHGLRQGYPLSPFLFILVMEGLHNALSTTVNSGLIRGVKFGSPEVTISHLFYADDLIITTEWNANDLDNIIRVLQVFYLASGLRINIQKSDVYVIGVSNVDVSSMASNSGCASGSFPFTYLRLPIGSNMSLTSSWQVLWVRFQSKLSSWKANLLSIRGRHTLIKVVLGSLGIYYFLIFKVPKSVLNSLERSRAMFFRSLKAFNLALLQKWRWRLLSHKNALWVKVIKVYMVRKVALIKMVTSIMREKDCLIIDRIDHGQWRWNWPRPNLGARNSADLLDTHFKISSAEINDATDVPKIVQTSYRGLLRFKLEPSGWVTLPERGSIAMVGRATEIASLLNQGNGPYMNSCNLHDTSAPTRSRAQVKRGRDGAVGAYTSTKCLLVQKRACEILTSLPTYSGLEFGKCYNLPTHSGPRIGVQRDIAPNSMNSVDASSWSSRGSQVSSELASSMCVLQWMIEKKIKNTKGVRLRGLEERKERKE
ncbi:putative RNA-directed DNA polymerase, eukaryota, reverse transcriptase zinc-binding domain protein [Tanacetum coccineum]|uniref:RNA-directed DNA polymerase, eukaryota, reverse transcriptase zinc-binding domain protein n=1 Tax=Tanacetum coccineum TaxID=301880 RepID=A0ABQ5CBZ6_9ASTR